MLDSNFTINNTTQFTISESCYFLSATSDTSLIFTNSFFKNISTSHPLFLITNTLTQISFTSSAFEDINRPVLELSSSNNSPITISGSTFSNLQSPSPSIPSEESYATGGACSLYTSSSTPLSITSSSFSSCQAAGKYSKGGALYIHLHSLPPTTFALSPITWGQNNDASVGIHLFILSEVSLLTFINRTVFPSDYYPTDPRNLYVAQGTDPYFNNDNVDFVSPFTPVSFAGIFLSPTGFDGMWSGNSTHPCLTLYYGLTQLNF
jgi:hypothetical protein